jgi:hypothetical protein
VPRTFLRRGDRWSPWANAIRPYNPPGRFGHGTLGAECGAPEKPLSLYPDGTAFAGATGIGCHGPALWQVRAQLPQISLSDGETLLSFCLLQPLFKLIQFLVQLVRQPVAKLFKMFSD